MSARSLTVSVPSLAVADAVVFFVDEGLGVMTSWSVKEVPAAEAVAPGELELTLGLDVTQPQVYLVWCGIRDNVPGVGGYRS